MPRHHPNFVIIHKEHRAIRQVHVRRSTVRSSMCDASSVFSLLCFIVVTLNYAVVVILKFRYVCVRCGHIYLFFHARISQWIFLMQIRNTWGIMGIYPILLDISPDPGFLVARLRTDKDSQLKITTSFLLKSPNK